MGRIVLRRELLERGDYKTAFEELLEQLNRYLSIQDGGESPYLMPSKVLVPSLRITSVTEQPLDNDNIRVSITTTAHSFLYECRYRGVFDFGWRRTWTQTNNQFSFELERGGWEAQIRVKDTATGPWSDWVGVSGSGDAAPQESLEDASEEIDVSPPQSLSAEASYRGIVLTWYPVAWSGINAYLVYRSTTNNFGSAHQVASTIGVSWTDSAVQSGTTYYYWVKAVHKRGFVSPPVGPASAVARDIIGDDLYDQIIDQTKLAQDIKLIKVVNSLPSLPNSDYPQGTVVFLTSDNKLYRSTGNTWTAEVPASDIQGQITNTQIADGAVTASKIQSGAVTDVKLASGAVTLAKFASGLRPIQVVSSLPSLPNSDYPQGATVFLTSDNKLYRSTGSSWTAVVPTTDLSGEITSSQIQDGAVTSQKIQNAAVNDVKLASGAVTLAKFASGLRPVQVVASLPSLPHSDYPQGATVFLTSDNKLYRSTGSSWTAAVPTSDLSGQISSGQIQDNAITAAKIQDGAVGDVKIASGAVTLAKFASSLRPVQVVSSLPTLPHSDYPQGAVVFLTSDNKLYRSTGTGWTAAVPTSDLSGQIATAQIQDAAVTAQKIQDGSVGDTKLASGAVTLAKFASGLRPVQVVSSLPTLPHSDYPQGATVFLTSDNKLYRSTGSAWTAVVPTSDLSGQISTGQIADDAVTAAKLDNNVLPFVADLTISPRAGYEHDQISYSSGTITLADGTAQSITAGTLNLSSNTGWWYVYFQVGSTSLSATQTYSDVLGQNRGLVAICHHSTDSSQHVLILPFRAKGINLQADAIAAGSITAVKIASSAITSDKIASNQITASHIQSGAITADKIQSGAVTSDKISANQITGSHIQADAINAGHIQSGAVGTDELAANAVTAAKIQAGAVTASKLSVAQILVDGLSITNNSPSSGYVSWTAHSIYFGGTQYNVSAGNTNQKYIYWNVGDSVLSASNTKPAWANGRFMIAINDSGTHTLVWNSTIIHGGQLVTGTITAQEIAAGTITGDKIASSQITGSHIQANQITGSHIQSDAITAAHIQSGAVSTDELASNSVTAAKIQAGAVTASKLAVAAIFIDGLSISNNTPSSGYISWTAHTIYYNGTAYSISSGNTNLKYVYWDAGNTTLSASNTKPGWANGRFMIAVNDSGIHTLVWNSTIIHGGQLVTGTITAQEIAGNTITGDKIAANQITSSHIQTDAINAGHIQSGAVGTDELAANAVTAAKIQAGAVSAAKLTLAAIFVEGLSVSNNTPSSGYISWSSHTIYYNGTAYSISAGNTNQKYVYWDVGNTTLTASNTKPSWASNRFMIAVNDSGTHTLVWNSTIIHGGQLVTGSITAQEIAAGTITGDRIAAGTITGDKIGANQIAGSHIQADSIAAGHIQSGAVTSDELAANAVTAQKIQAGAVTASKLAVADLFAENLSFTNNSPSAGYVAWSAHTLYYNGTSYSISSGNTNQKYIYWDVGNTSLSSSNSKPSWTGTRFMIAINDNGTHTQVWNSTLIHGGQVIAGTITAQEIAANSITGDRIAANQISSSHIQAGAIGTDHLVANSITSGKIQAGAVGTDQLAANAVTASKIAAQQIASQHIATEGLVAVPYKSAASGARVELFPTSSVGLRVIGNNNQEVMTVYVAEAGGFGAGDVYLGSEEAGKYLLWKASGNVGLGIKGSIDADVLCGYDVNRFKTAVDTALQIADAGLGWSKLLNRDFELQNLGGESSLAASGYSQDNVAFSWTTAGSKLTCYRGILLSQFLNYSQSWTVGSSTDQIGKFYVKVSDATNGMQIKGITLKLRRVGTASKTLYVRVKTLIRSPWAWTTRLTKAISYSSIPDTIQDVTIWFDSAYTYSTSHGDLYIGLEDTDFSTTYVQFRFDARSGHSYFTNNDYQELTGYCLYYRLWQETNPTNYKAWCDYSTPYDLSSQTTIKLQLGCAVNMASYFQLYLRNSTTETFLNLPNTSGNGYLEDVYVDISSVTRNSVNRIGLRATAQPPTNLDVLWGGAYALVPQYKPVTKPEAGTGSVIIPTDQDLRPHVNAILLWNSGTSLSVVFPLRSSWGSVTLSWNTTSATGKYIVQVQNNIVGKPTSSNFTIASSLQSGYTEIATLYHVNGTGFLPFYMPRPRCVMYAEHTNSNLQVVSGGSATSWTNVNCSGILPTGRRLVAHFHANLTGTSIASAVFQFIRDPITQSAANWALCRNSDGSAVRGIVWVPTDTNAIIQYIKPSAISAVNLFIIGYEDWGR